MVEKGEQKYKKYTHSDIGLLTAQEAVELLKNPEMRLETTFAKQALLCHLASLDFKGDVDNKRIINEFVKFVKKNGNKEDKMTVSFLEGRRKWRV
ncbi:MAG: hypothetical protein WCV70_04545 [Patescibacteria group bacterium]|jgi:hypothetical protein